MHSDIVGKLEPSFPDKFKFDSTFLYGKSRYTFAGMMCHRREVHAVSDSVTAMFREFGGAEIQKLHTDGAKEYIALQNFLRGGNGDKSFSPPYLQN